jgi:hypothetical protein
MPSMSNLFIMTMIMMMVVVVIMMISWITMTVLAAMIVFSIATMDAVIALSYTMQMEMLDSIQFKRALKCRKGLTV